MSIDKNTVKHISKLARIYLDEKKTANLSKDLTSIMKFIEKLNKLNTEKTKPLTSIIDASLKTRKDEIKDGKRDGRCTHCGCFMNVKVHYAVSECPIDKWKKDCGHQCDCTCKDNCDG